MAHAAPAPYRSQAALVPFLNLLAYVTVLVVNYLSNALPIAGRTAGEISDMYPTLFTPAGYVFSIWGVIYLGLGAFVVYGLTPAGRANPRLQRIGFAFVASCALNVVWLLLWHNLLIGASQLVMLGLLASLVVLYERLAIGREGGAPRVETWTTRVPFSIYLGWITVATVANTSIWLTDLGWRGEPLPEAFWAVLVIAVATVIGVAVLRLRRDLAFNLVLVWAFVGIAAARGTDALLVTLVALACAVLIAALLVSRTRAGPGRGALAGSAG